jgi:hypothetical protein
MDMTCSFHGKDKKCVQNYSKEILWEKTASNMQTYTGE